ncbi:hypothetical protein GFS03_01670 [Sulfolobus sp. E5-1-F]|uniref:hypothetical protein n=1 Tax=Sulfolobaceae TaxID=118883 RepID=UPI0012955062|nr:MULTISPECIES: hypothetical protein [unclassified Sulfolobus]QGA53380.1 hypothetical protein GFS03_01670 [Sulfolobus sp. E5-1-F]QGA68485.1 hypothetical protein GFS33_06870 [Sulfolobus sp. E11-6]
MQSTSVEIYLNIYSFRHELEHFTIDEKRDEWLIVKDRANEKYILKEFSDYGILIYPIHDLKDDILSSFSFQLSSISKLKEVLYTPEKWIDRLDLRINDNSIEVTSLVLDYLTGIDIINSLISSYGFQYAQLDDSSLIIKIRISRPLNHTSLDSYIRAIYDMLKLYYNVKNAQEEIASKITLNYIKSI